MLSFHGLRREANRSLFGSAVSPVCGIAGSMSDRALRATLEVLRETHRDLDAAIAALVAAPVHDQLQLARLKKRKLKLRDEIADLEDRLIPDIIA